jgi:hypothetical protein
MDLPSSNPSFTALALNSGVECITCVGAYASSWTSSGHLFTGVHKTQGD